MPCEIWSDWHKRKIEGMEERGEDPLKGEPPAWVQILGSTGTRIGSFYLPMWMANDVAADIIRYGVTVITANTRDAVTAVRFPCDGGTMMLTRQFLQGAAVIITPARYGHEDNEEPIKRDAIANAKLVSFLHMTL